MYRHERNYHHQNEVVYRREPICCCGCKREIVDGWEWDGDYLYDDDCILRFMKEHVLKAFEIS